MIRLKILSHLLFTLVLTSALSVNLLAQEKLKDILPLRNGKVTYTAVVKTDSVSTDDIYDRARTWLAYNSDYFKVDNDEELICEGHFTYGVFYIYFIINVKIKENRYMYELTNFQVVSHTTMNGSSNDIDSPLEQYHSLFGIGEKEGYKKIDELVNSLISSLKKAIQTPIDDDW